MLFQALQIVASVLILVAFGLTQRGTWTPKSLPYLWLNFVGSLILAVEAGVGRQWGFLLLEGIWAAISVAGVAGVQRARPPAAPPAP